MKEHFCLVSETLFFSVLFYGQHQLQKELGWGSDWERTGKGLGKDWEGWRSAMQLEVPKADCSPLG